jgi:PAS domain S-box-containing protein
MNTTAPAILIDLSTTDEIALLLDASGRISAVNKAFKAFVGYPAADVQNKSLPDFIEPGEKQSSCEFVQKALAGAPAYGHLAFETRSGERRIGKVTAVPFFENGAIGGVTCFIQDVTATVNFNRDIYDQEQRLKAIFYHEQDGVAVLSLDATLVDLNPAGVHLFEGSRDILIGRHFPDLIQESDRACFVETNRKVGSGKIETFQFRITSLRGSVRWLEANIVPLRDKYEKIYATLSVMRDITGRKQIEETLRKQEERLESAKRLARIGYWEYDFAEEKSYSTEGVYEIYGLRREECPEISPAFFMSLVHPDDKDRMQAIFSDIASHPVVEEEHRMIRPDGRVIYIHHSGNLLFGPNGEPMTMTGAVQDITERKESEKRLLLSEQKFKSLVQNGSDLIVIMDDQGVFQYISPSVKHIAGHEPDEMVGRNAFEMIHPDDLPIVMSELTTVIDSTNSGQATPHRFLNAAGEWIWLESKGANLMHDDSIRGIIINARNITDRIRLQERLDKELANRQKDITSAVIKAQESERSQLGQELHDNVNQVLTTVKLYNEMLRDGLGEPTEIVNKSIRHLQGCINEIRSISKRLSAPTLGSISLTDSIHELIDSINLTKKITLHCTINESEQVCVTQDVHLTVYRIIQEQLNNILKHAEAKHAWIELVNQPGDFSLRIRDDGRGFDVNAKRTGIGITNIITRAENINGRVSIESAPGEGTTLVLTFPPMV